MDAASSSSDVASMARRGCSGLGLIRSMSTLRTPPRGRPWRSLDSRLTMAGESSRSSDRRRAAAARKSVLAKVDNLPCQLAVRARCLGAAGVGRDRTADERRLAQLHGVANDRVEHVVVAHDAQLVEHVPGEIGASVEERRQEAENAQAPVQL